MNLFDIARELIEIESITPNEEPVVAWLEAYLERQGWDLRSERVAAGRRNLQAGPERPGVLFCTHTDTVPPYVPYREDAEHLWGRGACDTKGITACFLEAGRRLREEGVEDFGYLFVVGEEVDNIGAREANRSVRADWVIVGEPTENRLAVGHKGCLGVRVEVEGVAAHSAYPERGDSAVHRLLACLERVRATDFGRDPVLGAATLNIGRIEGGVAPNVLAPSASARLFLRVVDSIERNEEQLAACFTDPATGRPDERIRLETYVRMPRPTLERVDGFEECTVSFGTDAPFLADVGKTLLIGPGSIEHAHTLEERISRRSMELAVEQYVELVRRLCGQA